MNRAERSSHSHVLSCPLATAEQKDQARERMKPKSRKAAPRPVACVKADEKRAQDDAAADARWDEIRSEVRARCLREAVGRCEWCLIREAADPHHLIGGHGKRRIHEAPETVAAVCRPCHRKWEANDVLTLTRAIEWAAKHRFGKALAEANRRLERTMERRAQHPERRTA